MSILPLPSLLPVREKNSRITAAFDPQLRRRPPQPPSARRSPSTCAALTNRAIASNRVAAVPNRTVALTNRTAASNHSTNPMPLSNPKPLSNPIVYSSQENGDEEQGMNEFYDSIATALFNMRGWRLTKLVMFTNYFNFNH
jgi:hypothetical protein